MARQRTGAFAFPLKRPPRTPFLLGMTRSNIPTVAAAPISDSEILTEALAGMVTKIPEGSSIPASADAVTEMPGECPAAAYYHAATDSMVWVDDLAIHPHVDARPTIWPPAIAAAIVDDSLGL